jgi:hypothetical protein
METLESEALMEISRKTGKSLAGIARDLITEKFARDKIDTQNDRIRDIIGMRPGDGAPVARNHDRYGYPLRTGKFERKRIFVDAGAWCALVDKPETA